MSKGSWYVYILRCADGSLYVGHTRNIDRRVATHRAGKGAQWTAQRVPVELAYQETQPSRSRAVQRERQIKRWSRGKKEALIAGDLQALKQLSKRRTR